MNLYLYVFNQPVGRTDPFGLCPPEGSEDPCGKQCGCDEGSPGDCVDCRYSNCMKRPWDKEECKKNFTKACEKSGCVIACRLLGLSTGWRIVCSQLCDAASATGKPCDALAPLACERYEKWGGREKDCWDKRKEDKENWIKDCLG